MTTPKRYEVTARRLMQNPLGHGLPCVCAQCEDRALDLVRTAAREAQVRVLEAAQDMLIFENRAFRALVTLKERIERGEDL